MSDPDRFVSLFKRQQAKLQHAERLLPAFQGCGHELGRMASLRDIAKWLEARGVKPSSLGKGKWTAQTVKEFTENMDGAEPNSILVESERQRNEGMRIAICRELLKAESGLDVEFGSGAADQKRREVQDHCMQLLVTAQKVRGALFR